MFFLWFSLRMVYTNSRSGNLPDCLLYRKANCVFLFKTHTTLAPQRQHHHVQEVHFLRRFLPGLTNMNLGGYGGHGNDPTVHNLASFSQLGIP